MKASKKSTHNVWNESLTSDSRENHQYQQKQLPLLPPPPPKPLNIEKTTKNGVANTDPGLGQVHKYGIVKPVNRIPTLKLH